MVGQVAGVVVIVAVLVLVVLVRDSAITQIAIDHGAADALTPLAGASAAGLLFSNIGPEQAARHRPGEFT